MGMGVGMENGKWADKSQVNSRQAEAMLQKVAATGAVAFSISLKWKIFCKYFRVPRFRFAALFFL